MEGVENAVVTMGTERLVLKIVFQIEIDTNRDGDNFITRKKRNRFRDESVVITLGMPCKLYDITSF